MSQWLERLLERGLVGLALRRRETAVEIDVERPERELGAIGILEAQLAVANDPGAVQNAAGTAIVRTDRTVDIDDRRGAVGLHRLDDQRGAELRRPGGIAPDPDKRAVALRNGAAFGETNRDRLGGKHALGRRPEIG